MSIRVAHIVDSLEPCAGSIAVALEGLLRTLQRADIHSTVITRQPWQSSPPNVPAISVDDPAASRAVTDCDCLHFHGLVPSMSTRIAAAARRAKKPMVVSPLGAFSPNPYAESSWPKRAQRWNRDRTVVARAAVIATLNEAEANDVRLRWPTKSITVLPYGMDFHNRDCSPTPPDATPDGDRKLLLYLGPIHPIEGIVPLLRAVAQLGHDFRGWRLMLAGPERNDWHAQLSAAIERKGMSSRIAFDLNPDRATQRKLLANASLLVSPSLCVRPPISVTEAVRASLPVVASHHGIADEIANHLDLCRPDRESLRDHLRREIRLDDRQRKRAIVSAQQAAQKSLDWAVLVGRYVDLYSSLVS